MIYNKFTWLNKKLGDSKVLSVASQLHKENSYICLNIIIITLAEPCFMFHTCMHSYRLHTYKPIPHSVMITWLARPDLGKSNILYTDSINIEHLYNAWFTSLLSSYEHLQLYRQLPILRAVKLCMHTLTMENIHRFSHIINFVKLIIIIIMLVFELTFG